MHKVPSSLLFAAATSAAALAALGVASPVASADAHRRHVNPEFDQPERQYPRPSRRIKLLGGKIVLQRINDSGNLLEFNPATEGVTGITLFRLVYRTNVYPIPSRSADVQATATIGRTIFHDGYQWNGYIGPFTGLTVGKAAPCFSKSVFLPTDNPAYAVGKTLPVRINFPRTRQRITLPATVTTGTLESNDGPQVDDVEALGCPVREKANSFVNWPGAVSPASLLPRRYRVPHFPR
jgi:hypothetical protein